jgi:hypothetical protein
MTVALQLLDQERLVSKMLLAFRYVPFGLDEVLQKDVPIHDVSIAHQAIALHRTKRLVAEL